METGQHLRDLYCSIFRLNPLATGHIWDILRGFWNIRFSLPSRRVGFAACRKAHGKVSEPGVSVCDTRQDFQGEYIQMPDIPVEMHHVSDLA